MIELGNKHECLDCGTKFYDLGRTELICPQCGGDQKELAESEAGTAKTGTGSKKTAAKKKKKKTKKKAVKKETSEEVSPADEDEESDAATDPEDEHMGEEE